MNAFGDVLGGNLIWDNYHNRGAYVNFSVSATDESGSLQALTMLFGRKLPMPMLLLIIYKTLLPAQLKLAKIRAWQNAGLCVRQLIIILL